MEPTSSASERNWLPLALAAGVILAIAAIVFFFMSHGHKAPQTAAENAALDAYAASLPISDLRMSESGNLAGGKLTYIDGHITNQGNRVVSGVTVQVLFRGFNQEVIQNESQSLKLIRTHDPYVDTRPVSAAPIKPGANEEFRLIFDSVKPMWNGAYPEVRVLHVDFK
jgi:hypothetical protein